MQCGYIPTARSEYPLPLPLPCCPACPISCANYFVHNSLLNVYCLSMSCLLNPSPQVKSWSINRLPNWTRFNYRVGQVARLGKSKSTPAHNVQKKKKKYRPHVHLYLSICTQVMYSTLAANLCVNRVKHFHSVPIITTTLPHPSAHVFLQSPIISAT